MINNKYTPFNVNKVLCHSKHFESILTGNFMAPVTCEIDPADTCNHDCFYCINPDKNKVNAQLSKQILFQLIDDLSSKGTKSITFTGGGEPLTNKNTVPAIEYAVSKGLEVGLVTNGGLLPKYNAHLTGLKFMRVSIDAATEKTHRFMHKPKQKNDRIQLLQILTSLKFIKETNPSMTLGCAFLVHPNNVNEIYEAAKLVKNYGGNYIQIKPIWMQGLVLSYQIISKARKLIKKAQTELNTNSFKVYGTLHRFDETQLDDWPFKSCTTTPLIGIVQANGDMTICCQKRYQSEFIFGNIFNGGFFSHWGTQKHKQTIAKINIENCPICRYIPFNMIMEQVFMKDNMHRNFF